MLYREQRTDIERSLHVLRSLPADIWVTGGGRAWGRYRKFVASRAAKNPVDAFNDPAGSRRSSLPPRTNSAAAWCTSGCW
jgi:hypothetical protein